MTLDELVQRLKQLRMHDPQFAGLKMKQCAQLLLRLEFGGEPTEAEVLELARAVIASLRKDRSFFSLDEFYDADFLEELADKSSEDWRPTGGGRHIIRKSEHRAG